MVYVKKMTEHYFIHLMLLIKITFSDLFMVKKKNSVSL